jgi:DNA primase
MKTLLAVLKKFNPTENPTSGEIRMMCPHRERHTEEDGLFSCFLNAEKNTYHCFSCKWGGSALQLLTTKLGVSFSDAVELVQVGQIKEEFEPYESYQVEEDLPSYLPEFLMELNRPPKEFLERGFTKETLKHFKVSYSQVPSRKTGKMRDTITIPCIQNRKLVGVKFRFQSGEKRAFWYSEGFVRENFVYNEPEKSKKILLVEGESDVWRSHQNRIEWCGSTLGTEMSPQQAKRLKRYEKVYLAYDNDEPGTRAAESAYHNLKLQNELLFVPYTAEDPGECGGREWRYAVNHATDYYEYTTAMSEYMGDDYLRIKEEEEKNFLKKAKLKR